MQIPKTLKEYIKAGLAGAFLLSVAASLIAGGFFWDPAWRRDPSSPIRTYPIYGGMFGFVFGLVMEFRRRKLSKSGNKSGHMGSKEVVVDETDGEMRDERV